MKVTWDICLLTRDSMFHQHWCRHSLPRVKKTFPATSIDSPLITKPTLVFLTMPNWALKSLKLSNLKIQFITTMRTSLLRKMLGIMATSKVVASIGIELARECPSYEFNLRGISSSLPRCTTQFFTKAITSTWSHKTRPVAISDLCINSNYE